MLKTIALALITAAACTDAVNEPPADAQVEVAPVTCTAQVLQTIDSASTCAVTVTVEVACTAGAADVASATVTATTAPWLDTGEMSGDVAIACGQTQRMTFGWMPCAEAATGIVALDEGAKCSATVEGL